MKWRKIEEYFKGNFDWVLVKYYDVTGYECIPTVMEFNKEDGKWHYNDKDYTVLDDIFKIKYFVDMQEIEKSDK